MVFPDRTDDAEWKVKVDCDRVDHVMLTLIQLHCITPKLRVANHAVIDIALNDSYTTATDRTLDASRV
jgi:hypothetical protein